MLRRISIADYIILYEETHNLDFNLVELDQIKTEYEKNVYNVRNTINKKCKSKNYIRTKKSYIVLFIYFIIKVPTITVDT